MDVAIRSKLRERAQYKCKYCQIPEAATPFIAFHAEHIIARQHQTDDSLENLALSTSTLVFPNKRRAETGG